MDVIDPILSIASGIYKLVKNVKANKKRCHRVSERVAKLEGVVRSIQQMKKTQTSAVVEKALMELRITLQSAQELIKKQTEANWLKNIRRSGKQEEEFRSVNERLDEAFMALGVVMQVDHGNLLHKLSEQTSKDKEDEDEDIAELRRFLLELKVSVETLNKPSIPSEAIREIKPSEIKYDHPKKPFKTTSSSEFYKGQFCGSPVAIKRYINPLNTSVEKVKAEFKRDTETMKQFQSPNILRMYGICIEDERDARPIPQFLIIVDYCEKGSLRQVLDSECLSWTMKARMCLDAARGLYRLHQTEEKSKVHGCINSSKFLVDKDYKVKLAGFELSKTESSLRRTTKDKTEIRSLCYSSPNMLSSLNNIYSKECEIYSFGIVLWEVATRKKPFDGLTDEEILQKVGQENYKEDLPDDCPEALGQLINECRAYDGFQRPSSGVLMDRLCIVVAQLEELEMTF
ncbi:mixed lineage kinase domain-like protein [Parambassis ranga]|uniref:Mixed lineage kinase domain-like protein n=1 Tax=Parambassis ranga TaxID=210632 RepID=A0A6P7J129_9TELE|nr:mixed lineage kinase domain-like protein [Parambassis ranga]XP_028270239.1 mixed lineage kinase domain-like protein [Parambassis ranga]